MNDRPLTYAGDDVSELQPLTPSMLLHGHRIHNLPISLDIDEINDPNFNQKELVTRRFQFCTKLITDLMHRWRDEYLVALRERDRDLLSSNPSVSLIGKLVSLQEDNKSRLCWKMGLIQKVHRSSDGLIRSVDVKTATGVTTRPIAKLYPLELDVDLSRNSEDHTPPSLLHETSRPSRRLAAEDARKKISDHYAFPRPGGEC